MPRHHLLLLAGLAFLAVLTRAPRLGEPRSMVFDEAHYVPTANYWAGLKDHPGWKQWEDHPLVTRSFDPVFQHPPLGKWLITFGTWSTGGTEEGQRWPSLVAGLLSLAVFYFTARKLWQGQTHVWDMSLTATALLSWDYLHIVQSRVAMLDMFSFFTGGVAILAMLHLRDKPRAPWWRATTLLALTACLLIKYVNVLYVAVFFLGMATGSDESLPTTRRERVLTGLFICSGAFLLTIGVASTPFMVSGMSFVDWAHLQWIGAESLTNSLTPHRYGSQPAAWLFDSKAIWYFFDVQDEVVRAVVAMGNPLLWGAFIPSTYVLFRGLRRDSANDADSLVLVWFLCLFLPYMLILWQRQGFIYYMLPCVAPMSLVVTRGLFIVAKARWVRLAYVWLVGGATLAFLPFLVALPVGQGYYRAVIKLISP